MSEPVTSQQGTVASHPSTPQQTFRFAPTTTQPSNAVGQDLIVVACLSLHDVCFEFDSSFLKPELNGKKLSDLLNQLPAKREEHRNTLGKLPLATIFGHADPVGTEDYNKQLSGRRAKAVYALLTRKTAMWNDLYNTPLGGDNWQTNRSEKTMRTFLGPSAPQARTALFQAYMDAICPPQLQEGDFVGRGKGAGYKGDLQGCSKFNPLLIFSADKEKYFSDPANHAERNAANRTNRRVVIFLCNASTVLDPALWPCPTADDTSVAACHDRFFPDSATRLAPSGVQREYEKTGDTWACLFYSRIASTSPCEHGPHPCPSTITITAPDGVTPPCLVIPVGGSVQLRAVPGKGAEGGGVQNRWTTTSNKVTLENADQEIVTVRSYDPAAPPPAGAVTGPSATRGAEVITVQRTSGGCGPVEADAKLTVIRVKFSKSDKQSYGYDDMDTPADPLDDHVSVKQLDTTMVHTVIEGGLNGNEIEFICDKTTIAQPGAAPATAEFDLPVNGQDTKQGETILRARVLCHSHAELTHININTYKEKPVNATVLKAFDSRSKGTTLRFPKLDLKSAMNMINPKYKEAVALMTLTDFSASGDAVDIPYDTDKNGRLTWDIAAGGGQEWDIITKKFTGAGQKIVIVHDMISVYFLAAAAAKGATAITINDVSSYLKLNASYPLGVAGNRESVTVKSMSGATITLTSPLAHDHANKETLEFPAGGWGGGIIVIIEGTASEDILKWTFGHELGHSHSFDVLADVDYRGSIMHWQQDWTDHRLRYFSLKQMYSPFGMENQWQKIPR